MAITSCDLTITASRCGRNEPMHVNIHDDLFSAQFPCRPGEQLMNGELWREVSVLAQFTRREQMVCRLLFEGRTRDRIAEQLDLKPRTVRQYLENIHTKLNVHHRVDVVLRIVELRDRVLSYPLNTARSSDVNGHTKE